MPGAGRIGDKAMIQGAGCAHGCPACPHPGIGPVILGSNDVIINSRPAARINDNGIHSVCCGANMWIARVGAPTVFINGKPAWRQNDMGQSCGATVKLVEGSANVIIGDSSAGGGGGGNGQARFESRSSSGTSGNGSSTSGGDGAGGGSHATATAAGATPARTAAGSSPPAGAAKETPPAKAWLEVVLTDEDGKPLAGHEYKLVLPDYTVVEGKLDDKGRVRKENLEPGLARLSLPDIDPDVPPVPPPGVPGDEETSWLDVQLHDADGHPAANLSVELELPDGKILDEKTDADGWIRKMDIPAGQAKISVPDEDKAPPPAVPPRPAPPEEPTSWIDVQLTDAAGLPAANRKVKIVLPDGKELDETLDDAGRLYKDKLPKGEAKIHLLDEDAMGPPPSPPPPTAADDETKGTLDIQLVDDDGLPAAGRKVKVVLPDGTQIEETLDENGRLFKADVPRGEAKIHLLDEDAMAPPAPPAPAAAGAATEPKASLDLELTDDAGRPMAGLAVKLELADGTVLEEKLDENGRLHKEGLVPGDVKLHLPEDN